MAPTSGSMKGMVKAICIARAFIGCPLGKENGRPISRKTNCVAGKMKTPPTTKTAIAALCEYQVASAADTSHKTPETD